MKLTIRENFTSVQKLLDTTHADIVAKALPSAVNKTLAQGNTQMVRAITKNWNVSAAYVRQRLRIRRATFNRGALTVSGELIGGDGKRRSANLIAFLEKSTSLAEGRKRAKAGTLSQLHFKIKRVGGKQVIPGAFIGNKGRTVFIREGRGRLPIKPVRTIDVPQMFNARLANEPVVAFILRKFNPVFESEVRYYTQRFNSAK